ncbi:MAG: nucleotide exchange factor GrpE [Oscillospiraceae bacterium]
MEEKEKTTTTAPEEQQEAAHEETNELETLKAELEKLKKEKDELNDRYLRTLAEYDNFRKRSQREKDAVYGDATADAVKKLLPILDSFDRASNYECPDAEYKKGIDLIGNSIKEAFDQLGLKEIPALGEQFDPKFHNAVMHNDDPAYGENVITDVYRKGYTLGDKVIRFSMVVVAN